MITTFVRNQVIELLSNKLMANDSVMRIAKYHDKTREDVVRALQCRVATKKMGSKFKAFIAFTDTVSGETVTEKIIINL